MVERISSAALASAGTICGLTGLLGPLFVIWVLALLGSAGSVAAWRALRRDEPAEDATFSALCLTSGAAFVSGSLLFSHALAH